MLGLIQSLATVPFAEHCVIATLDVIRVLSIVTLCTPRSVGMLCIVVRGGSRERHELDAVLQRGGVLVEGLENGLVGLLARGAFLRETPPQVL